jgi:molybdopterin molybdotransferase
VLFLIPAIRALLGDQKAADDPTEDAILGADLPPNRDRQDYMRASLSFQDIPVTLANCAERLMLPVATPHLLQDSSMLSILERSDVLLVRPPHAPAATAGEPCRIIRLDRFC